MKTKIMAAVLAILMLLPAALTACEPGDGGEGTNTAGATGTDGTSAPDSGGDEPDDGTFNGFVLTASKDGAYDISENLFGIFLEDINHAVDGGLYAEQVFNRSFEYGDYATMGGKQGWDSDKSTEVEWDVIDGTADGSLLNAQNPHYARVTNASSDSEAHGIRNQGYYKNLYVEEKTNYTFSVYARGVDGYTGPIYISVETPGNTVYATGEIKSVTGDWQKYEVTLTPESTASSGLRLVLRIDKGTVDLDMVSLISDDVYEGKVNGKYGIRRDLGEALEALHPHFFRFPGGCVIEGHTLECAYDWKDSIGRGLEFTVNGEKTVGDVATRPICVNTWADHENKQEDAYYMTYGLGFYEYMLFCEDLGCEPIPVLNCGYSCQGRNPAGPESGTPEFQRYVDDALDFIEFCRGGADTEWGSIRIAMGHPEPFSLTYLGIGNEQFGNEYNKRYAKFREALIAAEKEDPEMYGGIKLIMANGLTSGSRDGWDAVERYGKDLAAALDEHYYNPPEWFLINELRYDYYDRSNPKVFIGEYASKSNIAKSAIAEAAYLTSVERNGDVVELATYAPLFAYDKHTQWAPNLIWYNAKHVWYSTNYYVQMIYSNNQSSRIIPSTLDGSGFTKGGRLKGCIGLGTWVTSAQFDDLVVTDNATGEVLLEDDFSGNNLKDYTVVGGNFTVKDGVLVQSNTNYPKNADTGDVIYIGGKNWSNYTFTFKAKKTGGGEGFIIPFAVKGTNDFWHWNIGGWGNTVSAVERAFPDGNGVYKTGQVAGTVTDFKVENGKEYEIKIVVDGYNVKGYIDGELKFDIDSAMDRGVYSVIGEDENDIIVKLVNTTSRKTPVRVDLSAVSSYEGEAKTQFIKFHSETADNVENKSDVVLEEGTLDVKSVFEYELDLYSMIVIRIPKK